MGASWTEGRVERAIALWNDGLSATEIARDLTGITRNAVLGKINRLWAAGDARVKRPSGPRVEPHLKREDIQRQADQRTLYILQRHEDDGATFGEIARELHTSKAAVNTEYYSVIRALRESEAA